MNKTDYNESRRLVLGLAALEKYKTDEFTINVVERSGISVGGIKPISDEDLELLLLIGWNAGNSKENDKAFGWAEYFKLEYVDY